MTNLDNLIEDTITPITDDMGPFEKEIVELMNKPIENFAKERKQKDIENAFDINGTNNV
jgi:hypothetical protein